MSDRLFPVVLALAWFGAASVLLSLVAALLARRVTRSTIAARPARAARTLFALRVSPALISIFFTVGVFLPSHFWWEPAVERESAGYSILVLAACGAAVVVVTIVRALWDMRATRAVANRWRSAAHASPWRTAPGFPVLYVADPSPVMSLVGIRRPVLFVTESVAAALTAEELELGLSHEAAHVRASDNLKRLIAAWCPDLLRLRALGGDLSTRWRAATELAADAEAVGASERRAVVLATALVKMARLELVEPSTRLLATSRIHHQALVAARVQRLLGHPVAPTERPVGRPWQLAIAIVAMLLAVTIANQVSLAVHQATEALIRVLP